MSKKERRASYVPLDVAAAVNDHGKEVQSGETCHVEALSNVFAWMRGYVNGWYGWPNDGKSTILDYLSVLKALKSDWKFLLYKPEDMDTVIHAGKIEIRANRIYKNLAWTLTGKTWNKNFSAKHRVEMMTQKEEMEALSWVTRHFFVLDPESRKFDDVMDDFKFYIDKFKIDAVILDPWNVIQLPDNERGDERLVNAFVDIKRLSMITNTSFNIVSHPKSMSEQTNKDGSFKVVNQFMQLGGSAWDMKMDGQYSTYRPNRHKKSSDPNTQLHNLKQREAAIVGVDRGEFPREGYPNEVMVFDKITRQYWFNDVNPLTGQYRGKAVQSKMDFPGVHEQDKHRSPFD